MNSGGGVNELTIRIMNWVGIPNDGTLDPEKTYQLAGYYLIFKFSNFSIKFPVWLRNRLKSTGLEPVLNHTEKI